MFTTTSSLLSVPQAEAEVRSFAAEFDTPNVREAVRLCETGALGWLRVHEVCRRSLESALSEVVDAPARIIDLGGPEGGRYWQVVTDHEAEDPDAQNAAINARVTGSIGATYNGATVKRATVKAVA